MKVHTYYFQKTRGAYKIKVPGALLTALKRDSALILYVVGGGGVVKKNQCGMPSCGVSLERSFQYLQYLTFSFVSGPLMTMLQEQKLR